MTQEDKDLLLKDLCARLSYGIKVAFFNEDLTYHSEPKTLTGIECINNLNYSSLEDEDGNTTIVEFVKPYLFPLSSMTEEQKEELSTITNGKFRYMCGDINNTIPRKNTGEWGIDENAYINSIKVINILYIWLLENHFDINGLISMGLAIDATGLNIY